MGRTETLLNFINSPHATVSLPGFVVNLAMAAVLSFALGWIYIHYSRVLSNRRQFASNFILLTMTTVVIITVIKSSLALSLGLVGALSIVRFRAAIKEPEELAYLFLAIAIGLGFGAEQRVVTLIGFLFIIAVILIKNFSFKKNRDANLFYLKVITPRIQEIDLEKITIIIKKYCAPIHLKRFDNLKDCLETSFLVGCGSFEKLNQLKAELCKMGDNVEITFFDYKGFL